MARFVSERSVTEIGDFLKSKKNQGQRVGLLLGHRTGVLFNDNLYEVLKRRTISVDELSKLLKRSNSTADDLYKIAGRIQSLDSLSVLERFKECYSFLGRHFSEKGIHSILLSTLVPIHCREEDELIARLIKAEFFNTIISTNVDTLLEDACILLGMKDPTDYQVIICGSGDSLIPGQGSSRCGQIVKIFGDRFSPTYYTAGNEFNLETDQELKEFLVSELTKDVIVIGYDPTWDRPLERAFQETGGTLWYVNEEQLWQNTYLSNVLNQRGSKYLIGPQWNYSAFLKALSDFLEKGVKREAEIGLLSSSSQPQSQTSQSQSQTRKKAFISYSHKDIRHMERLLTHLRGYLHTGNAENILDIWVDTRIPPGTYWKEEIRKALASAKIAILLISADFLASDFIREYELPALLEAAKSGEIRLLPVILGPSAFERTELHRYQVAENSFSQPLTRMKPFERDVIWKKLAEQIVDMLDLQE